MGELGGSTDLGQVQLILAGFIHASVFSKWVVCGLPGPGISFVYLAVGCLGAGSYRMASVTPPVFGY